MISSNIREGNIRKLLSDDSKKNIRPISLTVELTYRCNFRCIHCYIPDKDRQEDGEITFDEIKDILDQAENLGVIYVCFTGGEIFLRKDIFDIIRYARNKGFYIRLKTNGSLITKKIAAKIAKSMVNAIDISLYAFDEKGYKKITGKKGVLNNVLGAVLNLKKQKIPVRIAYIFLKENMGYSKKIVDFAKRNKIEFSYNFQISNKNDGCSDTLDHACTDSENVLNTLDYFNKKRKDSETSKKKGNKTNKEYGGRCDVGYSGIRVSPYGLVYPCVILQTPAGNIRHDRLSNIYKNSHTFNLVRSIKTFKDLENCKKCDFEEYCRPCLGERLNCNPTIKEYAEINKKIMLR